eukprot:3384063-Rhodomonas_salina.3
MPEGDHWLGACVSGEELGGVGRSGTPSPSPSSIPNLSTRQRVGAYTIAVPDSATGQRVGAYLISVLDICQYRTWCSGCRRGASIGLYETFRRAKGGAVPEPEAIGAEGLAWYQSIRNVSTGQRHTLYQYRTSRSSIRCVSTGHRIARYLLQGRLLSAELVAAYAISVPDIV